MGAWEKNWYNIFYVDNVYHILLTLLKKPLARKKVINWIKDFCDKAEIPAKPAVSIENIIEIIIKNEKLNYKNLYLYFLIIFAGSKLSWVS